LIAEKLLYFLSAMLHADVVVGLARGLGVSLHASPLKVAALPAAIRSSRRVEREQIAKQNN
jgi:hypothetical protein